MTTQRMTVLTAWYTRIFILWTRITQQITPIVWNGATIMTLNLVLLSGKEYATSRVVYVDMIFEIMRDVLFS